MASVSIQDFIEGLDLVNLTDEVDTENRMIHKPDINRTALQLTGFFDHFDADRIQIIGYVEYCYIKRLTLERRHEIYEQLLSYDLPCVLFARDLDPDMEMLEIAVTHGVPILQASLSTSEVMAKTISWLTEKMAPMITIHGVLVDVFGEGVLIMGESGIGKSETALELLKRGHRLVSDDAVEIRRIRDDLLVGQAPELTRHFIELRGIGIIDVKTLFGVESVMNTTVIDMVIKMEEWDRDKQYDRLGLEEEFVEFLGTKVVCHSIPIRPGRNLAIIVESAAVNHRQKKMGYNAAKTLYERLQNSIRQNRKK